MTTVVLLNAFADKKIKSYGNKCLLKLNSSTCLIDFNIKIYQKIYKNPKIVVVGGFDGKKLSRYIKTHKDLNNITYIEHDYSDQYNIGYSILSSLKYIEDDSNVLFINSSLVLHKYLESFVQHRGSYAVALRTKDTNKIGCAVDNSNNIINTYYGLPNELYDILYVCDQDVQKFKKILSSDRVVNKYFLFEIINLCIGNELNIKANFIKPASIYCIDNNSKIKNMGNKLNV